MTRLKSLLFVGLFAAPASADQAVLHAFVAAVGAGDAEACKAQFAPGAVFIDLGKDYSDRIGWFCEAVVDSGGVYSVSQLASDGNLTRFHFAYTAGSYGIAGAGELLASDGKIDRLIISVE